MGYFLAISALLFVFGSFDTKDVATTQIQSSVQRGEKLFDNNCAICHNKNGGIKRDLGFAVAPRDLTKSLLSKMQIEELIKEGSHHYGSKMDVMPPFKSVLKEQDIKDVATFISEKMNKDSFISAQTLYNSSQKIPEDKKEEYLKKGKKLYTKRCSFCHGLDGKGDGIATQMPEGSIHPYNLPKTLLTNEQKFLIVKYGAKKWGASTEDMPGWSKYDDMTLKGIVEYLDTL
jgi:mono/diheme cytochrome c family protein